MRTLKIRLIENAVKEEQNFLAEEYTQKFARSGLATTPYNTTAPFLCVFAYETIRTLISVNGKREKMSENPRENQN